MHNLIYLLYIPFLIINYKIIKSDFKNKTIPNRYLLYLIYLIPFYYIFLLIDNLNYSSFLVQIIIALIVSFILYNFWIRSAGDAKYLLVLALFIPNIWIIPFIWNIAILTLIYLFFYFIYFYFWKCLFNRKYAVSLYKNVKNDLKEAFLVYIKKENSDINRKKASKKIIKFIILFLVIYVSFRLFRIYIIKNIIEQNSELNISLIKELIEKYHFYLILIIIAISLLIIYLFILIIKKLRKYIYGSFSKLNINSETIENIFISSLILWLLWFILFEYIQNPIEIKNNLTKILTIYLLIYLIAKIIKYSYKITFSIAETYYIDVKDLKEWEIVDKTFLIKTFWRQEILWSNWNNWVLTTEPIKYFQSISNPIDKETKEKLCNIYDIVNNYQKQKITNYQDINKIKILFTFAFWWYIFSWFIISYIFWNTLFKYIMDFMIWFLKYIYHV